MAYPFRGEVVEVISVCILYFFLFLYQIIDMSKRERTYVAGVDFGTDSVRAILADTHNGDIVASAEAPFPRWEAGRFCRPDRNQFRQHPLDHMEALEQSARQALSMVSGKVVERVVAISVDTTGSTPVAVNRQGIPLALVEGFEENPNAMFLLWKDHTAIKEAEEINELAHSWGGMDYTRYSGGIYSAEWFWAKILHVLRHDEAVCRAAYSWVEHCDWVPALLTGDTKPLTLKRSRCAAGHKAMWHPGWEGLPSEEFLTRLDPLLAGIRGRLYKDTYTADVRAGSLSEEWAARLGFPAGIAIGVGALDAHFGAVGSEIKPYYLAKVMGTSTCDMMVAPEEELGDKLVRGICGQVQGSIVPGLEGLEAGQSAFGDIYAWFRDLLLWPARHLLAGSGLLDEATRESLLKEMAERLLPELSAEAAKIPVETSGIVALDWMNGRRTPDADQSLKGGMAGLSLGSGAPSIFRALVEATAFGSKKIVDRFREEGVRIDGVIALGGVAKKSDFVMQTVADVLDIPIIVARAEQACALGAAMAASVSGGVHPSLQDAQSAMGAGFEKKYLPIPENAIKYKELYDRYSRFGEFIEGEKTPEANAEGQIQSTT